MELELFNFKAYKAYLSNSHASLQQVQKVRYKAYRSVVAIPENEQEMMLDDYDNAKNALNHSLYNNGVLTGAIRGVVYSPDEGIQLPAMEIYNEEIETAIGTDVKIYESCRMVIDPMVEKKLRAQFLLVKISLLAAHSSGCKHILTAVRERHASFYTRMGMEVISEPKEYLGLNIPMVLILGRDLQERYQEPFEVYSSLAFSKEDVINYQKCLKTLS